MSSLEIDGSLSTDQNDIDNHVIGYYRDILAEANPPIITSGVDQIIPSLVSADENSALLAMPTFSKIREVVKGMDSSSASGPDRFTGDFYSHCWEIIEYDVCDAVQSFFSLGFIKLGLNSCNMELTLKCS